jgi:hypothetical protein
MRSTVVRGQSLQRGREGVMIDWGNPNWGRPGHNVHQADNGSWWAAEDERED